MSKPDPMTPADPEKRRRRRSEGVKVIERNQAIHLVLRRTITPALVAFFAALISVIAAVGIYSRPVPPVYLPVTEGSTLLPLSALSEPTLDRGAIGTYALEAVHALHTYDYINWRDQLNEASDYFSAKGWEDYQAQLLKSQTMTAVQARKMIVSIKPTGQITIPKAGLNPAHIYVWQVNLPVEVDYVAHASAVSGQPDAGSKQVGVITLFISRVPTTVNPQGIAIQLYRFDVTTGG